MFELNISNVVMGSKYVKKAIQCLCKQEVKITPKELIVFQDPDGQISRVIIIFEHDSIRHELALNMFHKPPRIQDLMKELPYKLKAAVPPPVVVTKIDRFSRILEIREASL